MTLLLALLSVFTLWAFLGVLIVGLYVIYKVLASIKVTLEKIATGVRAIEQETSPLGTHALSLRATLGRTASALNVTHQGLKKANRDLGAALPFLR
ncbi:MAG: hypothetical protein KY468_09675 [Armatimonadetes bacterium]|nr:hypothetical protein [Armatimonadota bacterium]